MSLTEISPLESSKITFKSIDFTFSGGEAITLPDLGSYLIQSGTSFPSFETTFILSSQGNSNSKLSSLIWVSKFKN